MVNRQQVEDFTAPSLPDSLLRSLDLLNLPDCHLTSLALLPVSLHFLLSA
jgi:hypothetical protein